MSDGDSNPRCDKCGLMKQAKLGGSLTSWISVCKCESIGADSVEEPPMGLPSVRICRKCGKRVNAGRAGSFTQWVFRADVCTCEVAEPGEYLQLDSAGNIINEPFLADSDEKEIEVDESLLPLERYKPLKEIGKGAWGSVYLCRDKLLNIKVAVKCMKAHSDEEVVSFQKEAKLVSKLEHPNIIKVYDFGVTEANAPYMVMEYFDGVSLKAYVEAFGSLPVADALTLFTGLCEALSYTHKKEIYHRDVTSLNVLVKQNNYGELTGKLVDFGIALEFDRQSKTMDFQGMSVVGTPAYMAPDQANGKKYDARSEVYSLGCVLFEALTGSVPFQGESPLEVLTEHAGGKLPDMVELNSELQDHPKLIKLIEKSLEKDPESRIQHMQNFRAHLLSAKSSNNEISGAKKSLSSESVEPESEKKDEFDSEAFEKSFVKEKNSKSILIISSAVLLAVLLFGGFLWVNIWNADSDPNKYSKPVKLLRGGSEESDLIQISNGNAKSEIAKGSPDSYSNWQDEPIYRFELYNPNIGDADTFIAGHKAKMDWSGVMTLFLMPPMFDRFYMKYTFDDDIAEVKPITEFFNDRFKNPIDFKVSNLKLLGEEKILGYLSQHYSCLADDVAMEFWATKEWNISEKLERTCSRIVGVPPGYGIPLKAYRSYTKEQIDSFDQASFPTAYKALQLAPGTSSKTIPWVIVSRVEKIDDAAAIEKLFRPVIKFMKLK